MALLGVGPRSNYREPSKQSELWNYACVTSHRNPQTSENAPNWGNNFFFLLQISGHECWLLNVLPSGRKTLITIKTLICHLTSTPIPRTYTKSHLHACTRIYTLTGRHTCTYRNTLTHTQTPMYTNTRIHIRQLGESATSLVTHRVLTESCEEVAGLFPVDAVGAVEELSDEFSHHLRVTLPVVGQALGRCPPVNIHRLPQGTAQHGLRLQVDKQVDL